MRVQPTFLTTGLQKSCIGCAVPKGIISQGAPPHVRESIDLCIRQKFPGTSSRASYSDKIGISQQCFWTDDSQVSGEKGAFS